MKKPGSGEAQETEKLARREPTPEPPLRRTLRALSLALCLWLVGSATVIFYASPGHVVVTVGEPSPRDIKAPREITYPSDVKTQEARLLALSKVADVYDGPDMALASEQLQTLQNICNYITTIRYDQFSDREQKLELLREIPYLTLSPSIFTQVLDLPEDEWQEVVEECLRVLDLIMSEEIRAHQVVEAQRRVQRLTSRTLSDEQQGVVSAFVGSLIVTNSSLDAEQTRAQRAAARDAVEPVSWTIREGESLLREGEIVTSLAFEKLSVLGLLDTSTDWREIVGVVVLSLIAVATLSAYIIRSHPLLLWQPRRELLLVLILVGVTVGARLAIPGHTLVPYLFPTAAAAMLVAIFMDIQLAIVTSVLTALVIGFNAGGSLELVVYALVGGAIGALSLWRMDQLSAFIRATAYVALANAATILAFHLQSQVYDTVGLLQLLGMAIINAIISSSLTFAAFSFTGKLFGVTTSLQLLELARPTHPLFRQLLIKAPGTYHHSIVISNMAERAAEAIGADALLARVGSYYHDIGKITRPYFFSENQSDGENPHDKLDPQTSADIIIAHTVDGLELARRYRLPDKVRAFIPEHHGTNLVAYFYRRANQDSGDQEVQEESFRYPGPKPQSKETAIVMLADSIEAWVRANRPPTQAEMERVIRRVINDRLISGQLDECDVTLKDLDGIRESFISILQGIFHPRIQYPERSSRGSDRSAPGAQQRAEV